MMFKLTLTTLALLLSLAGAQTVPFEATETLPAGSYEVTRVIDADTLVVTLDGVQRSVRLIGVDAPGRGKFYFAESTTFIKGLLDGQTVTIVPGTEPVDRFGRALGYVSVEGADVALLLAQAGFAQELTIPPNDQLAPLYKAAVAGARASKKGIHADTPDSRRKWRCSSFKTQSEAQSFYEAAQTAMRRDPFNLDANDDSLACQTLPKRRNPVSFELPQS